MGTGVCTGGGGKLGGSGWCDARGKKPDGVGLGTGANPDEGVGRL